MATNGEVLSKYVTLVSGDGFEFVVLREAACISGAIKRMLDPKSRFAESVDGRCVFEEITGAVMQKVAEYFYFNYRNRNAIDIEDMEIPSEMCLELLMAADYLDT